MARDKIVLVVDDESRIRRLLETSLGQKGYGVVTAVDGDDAITKLDDSVDLVLTDLKMPGKDGIALLQHMRQAGLEIPVIVMTAFGTVDSAVAAMKAGAHDYIGKPFDLDEIEIMVERALAADTMAREHRYLRESGRQQLEDLIGTSEAMQSIFEQIRRVAATDSGVLVTGETGTGKELVARAIHSLSNRSEKLFVPVNCAAIPLDLLESELFGHARGAFTGASETRVGKFEMAHDGTLFLDEIGDMHLRLQAKILRVLEEGVVERVGSNRSVHVDTRVISATHTHLESSIAEGTFRNDLYYRLNVIQIKLPPLRERREDIQPLAERFLEDLAVRIGRQPLVLDADALELLRDYPWPGNVRELRNVCERLSVLCDGERVSDELVARLVDMPEPATEIAELAVGGSATLVETVLAAEAAVIEKALADSGGNKARAARLLGISERNLWYKLKKHEARTRGSSDRLG